MRLDIPVSGAVKGLVPGVNGPDHPMRQDPIQREENWYFREVGCGKREVDIVVRRYLADHHGRAERYEE